MNHGTFITFEGIEGCGKSTQARKLCTYLQGQGHKVLLTREPGGCELGQSLRKILLDPANGDLCEKAELFMYLADRAQHVARVIRPALLRGEVVICDRYIDSTVAYQGYGRGMDPGHLTKLNHFATEDPDPALTILLSVPVSVGLQRARKRNVDECTAKREGRFEAEELFFHQRVRDGYHALAADNNRLVVVSGEGTEDEVFSRVLQQATGYL